MSTTQQIQRFPFKVLGEAKGDGAAIVGAAGFRPFPYKSGGAEMAVSANSVVETIEPARAVEPSFSAQDLYDAKQKSYEEGYAKGYSGAKSAEAEIDKQIQVSLGEIAIKLAAISEALKTRNDRTIKELADLVLHLARKVAGAALQNEPYAEIEKIITASLPLLFDEPNINISVNPELVGKIDGRIKSIVKSEGFKNNIEVAGNSAISVGSCEVQWNGGGLRSNKEEMWAHIEKICKDL
jgi:flagellar biosynthesis/type III secretory pathway protein FliH